MGISSISGNSELFRQMRQQMFSKADADGNGDLSVDEFKEMGKNGPVQGGKPDVAELFKKADTDGDGKLTTSELDSLGPPPKPPMDAGMMGGLLGAQEQGQGKGAGTDLVSLLFGDDEEDDDTASSSSSSSSASTDETDPTSRLRDLIGKYLSTLSQGSGGGTSVTA